VAHPVEQAVLQASLAVPVSLAALALALAAVAEYLALVEARSWDADSAPLAGSAVAALALVEAPA
jgi:hypothetical protein